MAQYPNGQNSNDGFAAWIPVILMLVFFWPLGLILLFRKLAGVPSRRQWRRQHPYDIRQEAAQMPPVSSARPDRANDRFERANDRFERADARFERANARYERAGQCRKDDLSSGRGLMIGGGVMAAALGMGALNVFVNALTTGNLISLLSAIFIPLGFCGAGLVMFFTGLQRTRRSKRFRRYLALIGKRERISVNQLAEAMPISRSKVMDDLEEMLEKGYLPKGYLDYASGLLVLTDEGLPEDKPEAPPAPAGMEREDATLREIREVNDCILNPELTRKIDRVGEITGRIFAFLRKNPDKENQLRNFLSYYLPTTLKILRAYAQMEAQGIEGENITAAKERIEGMMDKVVDGFEKQLDKLFQDDVLDITSDVTVLEQMLSKDGLSHGDGLQIGG